MGLSFENVVVRAKGMSFLSSLVPSNRCVRRRGLRWMIEFAKSGLSAAKILFSVFVMLLWLKGI